MAAQERHFFEFDRFRIDVEERRLESNGRVIGLTPRTFDILVALVQSAGTTVDKDELMRTVWQDIFVEEGNLNRHVSTLRKVLGDHPREQRFIKTIPKQGYRFTAKVTEKVESNLAVDTVSRGRLVIKQETIESFWSAPRVGIAAVMFVALVITGAWFLSNRRADARPATVEARDVYERGRDLWRSRSVTDLHEATLLLENAVRIDPQFALAHAALADAYAFDYGNWRKAEASATRAIDIDPTLGEPHASIGFVRMFWEWRLADAEVEFKKAVDLSPNYATGHQWFALNLAATSHVDAALVEIEKAAALDPGSIAIKSDRCQILYFAEKFDAAIEQCNAVLAADPLNTSANELLYQIYLSAGMEQQAVAKFAENLSVSKNERQRALANRFRQAYALGGIDGFRLAQIAFYREDDVSGYKLARVLAEAGDIEAAVSALEGALRNHDFDLVFYAPDPAFHSIRSGPKKSVIEGLPLR